MYLLRLPITSAAHADMLQDRVDPCRPVLAALRCAHGPSCRLHSQHRAVLVPFGGAPLDCSYRFGHRGSFLSMG